MTIAGIVAAGKERLSQTPRDILVVCILVFASSASFGLGILAGRDIGQGSDFSITEVPLTASPLGAAPPAPNVAALPAGGQVVASKSGSKYHLPWCAGAKAIKEENKIWFSSKEEAAKAGYTPAGNCKGL